MGGNLFGLGRLPRAEYLVIEAKVREFLDELVGDRYRIPRYYGSKPDFGDLDVVLSRAAIDELGGFAAFCQAIAAGLGVTRSQTTGHVYSTVVREFQVDYFIRAPELLDASYHYLSFNDLGNLIGKIYRRLGLKYGEDGLHYVVRRPAQPSYKRELLVSRDWPRILAFIGLDVVPWTAGFETLEDMFGWVVTSPYFSVAPYRERTATTDRRVRRRPTMARFIEYLDSRGIDRRYTYLEDRDAYLPAITAAFPEADLDRALAEERRREADDAALRGKFSGDLVRAWTGLDGKALGSFLRRFNEEHSRAELLAMDPDAIEALVRSFPPDD